MENTPVAPEVPETFESIKTNDKADDDFRVYSEDTSLQRVVDHYREKAPKTRHIRLVVFLYALKDRSQKSVCWSHVNSPSGVCEMTFE